MSETVDAEMEPSDALDALADLEGYEERLTAKAAGITWAIWGTAVPGIFLTYNAADPWIASVGLEWLAALLWIPWIAGATLATNMVWSAHAITLDTEHSQTRGWLASVGYTLVFFVLAGGVLLVDPGWGINGLMVVVTGLFTLAMAGIQRGLGYGRVMEPVAAGLTITGVGAALASSGFDPTAIGLAAAGLVGMAYYSAAVSLFWQG